MVLSLRLILEIQEEIIKHIVLHRLLQQVEVEAEQVKQYQPLGLFVMEKLLKLKR